MNPWIVLLVFALIAGLIAFRRLLADRRQRRQAGVDTDQTDFPPTDVLPGDGEVQPQDSGGGPRPTTPK